MQVRAIARAASRGRARGSARRRWSRSCTRSSGFREELRAAARPDRGGVGRGGARARAPGRHDDRGAAGGPAGRRDRRGRRFLLVRHERPDADDARLLARRRRRQVPHALPGGRRARAKPVRDARRRRRRRPDADRRRARHAPSHPGSSSGSAASTAATRARSRSATRSGSTTSAARRSASRSHDSPPPRPLSPRPAAPRTPPAAASLFRTLQSVDNYGTIAGTTDVCGTRRPARGGARSAARRDDATAVGGVGALPTARFLRLRSSRGPACRRRRR